MAGPLRVERDLEVARWLQQALSDDATVAVVVPPIFEAYARILHPATLETPTGETDAWGSPQYASREITWAEAASLIGERTGERQPWTLWLSRFGEIAHELPDGSRMIDGHVLADGSRIQEPQGGDTPVDLLARLTAVLLDEHGETEVLAAVWEGRGLDPSGTSGFALFPEGTSWWVRRRETKRLQAELRAELVAAVDPAVAAAMRAGDVLGLPREQQGRGHVLLRGQLLTFAEPTWIERAGLGWRRRQQPGRIDDPGRTLNAMWPASPQGAPAWFAATEIDLDYTLVGGSAQLVDRLLADPAFETERVRPTDPLVQPAP